MPHPNALTNTYIGLAIEVHRHLGPGLSEVAYERAFYRELKDAAIPFVHQVGIPVRYKGEIVGEYRPDFIIDNTVVIEIKSVERVTDVHAAQMRTYLRVTGCEVGLVLNFNEVVLRNGIRRMVLQGGEKTL
jgi:GxxExxY protein